MSMKPFSTYPEDREKLLALSREIDSGRLHDWEVLEKAYVLADLVKAILEDEEAVIEMRMEEEGGGSPPSAA